MTTNSVQELFALPKPSVVFVDEPIFPFRGDNYCHMFSENLEALHALARRIGLKHEWFQEPPKANWPHYDVSSHKRKLAIRLGARPVDKYECLLVSRRLAGLSDHEKAEQIARLRANTHYLKVAVTGTRDLAKHRLTRELVFAAMTGFHRDRKITTVVHGCARGLDTAVDEWCDEFNIDPLRYPVSDEEWKRVGKGAGIRRNATMVREEFVHAPIHDKIKACLSFPGDNGTADMTNRCIDAHIPTFKLDMERRRWVLMNPRLL